VLFRIAGNNEKKLLLTSDITNLLNIHRMTLHRWIDKKLFPKPLKQKNKNTWKNEVFQKWLDSKKAILLK
jgi:predicted DNA-binding transcriptional regulator AlpA